MSDLTDAQALAAYNDNGATLPAGINEPSAEVAVETPTTATAFQVSAKRDADLYINVRTAAALTIALGADSTAANVLSASQSDTIGTYHLFVPAGWYVKLTGTMANLVVTSILR